MSGLTQSLAAVCSTDWRDQFDDTRQRELTAMVRTAFIDTAACVLAGRSEAATRIAERWTHERFGGHGGTSSLLFGTQHTAASAAALVNAVAGHALDFDDVGLTGHPSVVLVPALWAEHERTGVHGFDLVQAYAKGYAAWGELQRRQKTSLHAKGWHPSAVFGAIGAAAAVSALSSHDEQTFAHSLGIAASLAGGVIANFGSMTKPIQIGRASEAGIVAAELAEAGIDASPDALDGPAGLLNALAGDGNVDLSPGCAEDLPRTLLDRRPGTKKYPVCYAAHRVVDGVIDLVREFGIRADDVLRIDAVVSETAAGVLRHHAPANLMEARFSLEFAAAAALCHGRLGTPEVSEPVLGDPRVRRLMGCVHTSTVATRCALEPSFAFTDSVKIRLHNGALLESGPIRFARGHAELPLTEAQVRDKFDSCAGADAGGAAEELLARIMAALE
jgi:2-methylcitrate dehydratase PrpD